MLDDLLERVRAATGADRSLDLAIGIALLDWGDTPAGEQPPPGRPEYSQPDGHFTGSVDAALALVERLLPTFTIDFTVYRTNGGEFQPHSVALLFCPYGEITKRRGDGKTPALALLAALLAALEA